MNLEHFGIGVWEKGFPRLGDEPISNLGVAFAAMIHPIGLIGGIAVVQSEPSRGQICEHRCQSLREFCLIRHERRVIVFKAKFADLTFKRAGEHQRKNLNNAPALMTDMLGV